jgi:hypothetical protein
MNERRLEMRFRKAKMAKVKDEQQTEQKKEFNFLDDIESV